MSITINATYENGVLKPAHPLPFSDQTQLRVTVEEHLEPREQRIQTPVADAGPTIADEILALARELPPGALDRLPDDLSVELDHYLYGTPKRSK